MDKYNYYGIKDNYVWCAMHYNKGHAGALLPNLFHLSDKLWTEGPRGGILMLKKTLNSTAIHSAYYIKKNSNSMKEFMWIKLQAKQINWTK